MHQNDIILSKGPIKYVIRDALKVNDYTMDHFAIRAANLEVK